jgi:UDP-2,3-diacylglucosamine pyrophosphatase LpxH
MSRFRMHLKFDAIYSRASRPENMIPFVPEADRIVCFSDHHKGAGGVADDFRKNAGIYDQALSHYEREGFRLILLGDNEELWETRIDKILEKYRSIIAKEISLAVESFEGGKLRLWGNHDKEAILNRFAAHLNRTGEELFGKVEYRQGLCLGPDIFLVHGHQGRFFEDKAWRVSRWAIKIIWKSIQRIFQIGMDGPAENVWIRESLERGYYGWARRRKTFLICGHTHRAVFASLTHYDRILAEVHELRKQACNNPTEEADRLLQLKEKHLRELVDKNHNRRPKSIFTDPEGPVPCYFNDGCCGYTNGITCIELDRGWIRLIKWDREDSTRQVLAENRLQFLIEHIKKRLPCLS